jgi:hypothetical protein
MGAELDVEPEGGAGEKEADRVSRWRLMAGDEMAPKDGAPPSPPWLLERAKLTEWMAAMPPGAGQGLAPSWTSAASRLPGPGATLAIPQGAASQAAGAAA